MPIFPPSLPGLAGPQTYARWPVWSGSTSQPVRFQPTPKKAATRLWHRARDFDRQTRRAGHHGGALGHAALQVLHTLIFDFLNHRTGRLDPSYAAIARKANVCERTVATALKRLRDAGVLTWARRCAESWDQGRYERRQETNAYAVQPETAWLGYRPPAAPLGPAAGTWGDHPPLPSVLALAATAGSGPAALVPILEADPTNGLAAALARLGRAFIARDS
jgi:hypothetical protein